MTTELTPTRSSVTAAPVPAAKPIVLWPPVTLIGLYWAAQLAVARLETFYFVGFLNNLASSVLLALLFSLWWWASRRVPLRIRTYGFLLMVGAGLVAEPLCHPSIGWWGILMTCVPVVLTAWTAWMIAARKVFPSWQWRGSVAVIVLCFALFPLIRINGLDSNLHADLRWRWPPTAEELFLAEMNRKAAASPANGGEVVALRPGDWPEFRGPNRDGIVRGLTLATDWEKTPPRLVWRQRLGPAWSSVIVVDGRLYTQEQRGEQEAVVCYEAQTGRELWAHGDPVRFWETVSGAGPRATPTFADGRVYALGGTGILNCLDAATGNRLWSHDIAADAGCRPPRWGFAGSPLVTDGMVIVFAGGEGEKNLLAYRADSGALAWSAPAGEISYSSPQLATFAGQRQCLFLHDKGVVAVDPANGSILWKGGEAMPGAPRTSQPHLIGSTQLLIGTYEGASVTLVDVTREGHGWKAVPRWTSRDLKPEFPDFVVHEGHAYGFDVSIFCCIELDGGKRCWKAGRYGRGQVVLLADQSLLLVLSETGEAVLLSADSVGHQELGRFQALEGKTWNHPVLAHGRLFVRNAEEIACYELAPTPPK
jgi:outer membrane protein assembly factor BamB